MKIGFIGLGIMGKPMAGHLVKAGHRLQVCDVNPTPVEELAALGAIPCATPAEAAAGCEVVFTMLPNSPQVEEVLLGDQGVLAGMEPGTVVVDTSSIDPTVSVRLEKEVAARDGELIDAPVSGGEPKAVDGTLSFMCGGKEEAFRRVKPLLEAMGSSVVLVGAIGSGNVTKLANQIIVAGNIAAMSEALVLATKSGVDPEKVFQAIRGGLAGSTVLDAKAPMILDRNFQPGFRIELHIKDLRNALGASGELGMDVPVTSLALSMMESLRDKGMGACDHSAVVRYYEEKEGTEVKRP